jgi:prepilin signal peptidase PulO-like enzyme (type II secretory pathway)
MVTKKTIEPTTLFGLQSVTSVEHYILVIFGTTLGAAVGSFVAAAGIRATNEKSVISTPSSCDHCGQELTFRDLVPVISFLVSHGTCRYCGSRLTWLYAGTEIGFAVIGGLVASLADWNLIAIVTSLTIILLGICAVSDFKAMLLPLPTMIAVGTLGLASQILDQGLDGAMDSLVASLIAVATIGIPGLLYWLIRRTQGFGEGDYWLMGAVGAWMVGIEPIILFYLATVLCLLAAIIGALRQGKSLQYLEPKPIGAFISIVSIIYLTAKLCNLAVITM